MTEALPHPQLLVNLAVLRDRALMADSMNTLAFMMANDLYPMLQYRQALVLEQRGKGFDLLSVSGLAIPEEDSPYLVWLRRAARWIAERIEGQQPSWLTFDQSRLPVDLADGWAEWWPSGIWCVPIHNRDGRRLGLLLFLLDQPPPETMQKLYDGLWQTWAHCWTGFCRHRVRWQPEKRHWLIAALVIGGLFLIPVRQTVLAPAEVISHNTWVVSSPIDGVIADVWVRPNQPVEKGTPLFTLDETTLRSRADVLTKEVAVADAELMAATQRAFDNVQSKNELTLLTGHAQQRRAELAAVRAQLQRTRVLAPRDGVAIFSDPNDWLGKPVVTGERIMQIADPEQPAMRIQLPVADAIALEAGASVTLFLTAYPLSPLRGKIQETSYQAKPSDEGVASYRLLADIEDPPEHARLGLHGTAKLYGQRVVLAYYLLRRPLSALRAWTGL